VGRPGWPEDALVRTATVLMIACPHTLGLAIPLIIAISTWLGARNGPLLGLPSAARAR
jgi:P-type Cu2+ transporter